MQVLFERETLLSPILTNLITIQEEAVLWIICYNPFKPFYLQPRCGG